MSPRPLPVWSRLTMRSTRPPRLSVVPTAAVVLLGLVLAACGGGEPDPREKSPAAPSPSASVSSSASPAAPSTDGDPTSTPEEAEETEDAGTAAASGGPATRTAPTQRALATTLSIAGRDAFAEHVVDLWAHALATNDTAALRDLAPGGRCEGCAALTRELADRAREGWYVALDRLQVTSVTGPRRIRPQQPTTVVLTVDIPATYSLNDDGSYRTTNPSHEGAEFEVDLVWRKNRYLLLGYALTG